jgi:hypothetical protein
MSSLKFEKGKILCSAYSPSPLVALMIHFNFSLLSFNECSLFLEMGLAFIFRLDFCSDFVLSLHQSEFIPLVYVGIHQRVVSKRFE